MSSFKTSTTTHKKFDILLDAHLDGTHVLYEIKSKGPRWHKNAVLATHMYPCPVALFPSRTWFVWLWALIGRMPSRETQSLWCTSAQGSGLYSTTGASYWCGRELWRADFSCGSVVIHPLIVQKALHLYCVHPLHIFFLDRRKFLPDLVRQRSVSCRNQGCSL